MVCLCRIESAEAAVTRDLRAIVADGGRQLPCTFPVERDRILNLYVEDVLVKLIAHLRPKVTDLRLHIVDNLIEAISAYIHALVRVVHLEVEHIAFIQFVCSIELHIVLIRAIFTPLAHGDVIPLFCRVCVEVLGAIIFFLVQIVSHPPPFEALPDVTALH